MGLSTSKYQLRLMVLPQQRTKVLTLRSLPVQAGGFVYHYVPTFSKLIHIMKICTIHLYYVKNGILNDLTSTVQPTDKPASDLKDKTWYAGTIATREISPIGNISASEGVQTQARVYTVAKNDPDVYTVIYSPQGASYWFTDRIKP